MELLFHLFLHVAVCIGVGFRVLEEDAELAIETSLNVLAIFKQDARFAGKFVFLVFGEDVLFEALDGRYPGRFADEGCDFADSWLDVW